MITSRVFGMRKIYRLKSFGFEIAPHFICDNGDKIVELKVGSHHTENYHKYQLEQSFVHCDSKSNVKLEDYFFEDSNIYSNGNAKNMYQIEEVNLIPGLYHSRIFKPIHKSRESGLGLGFHDRLNRDEGQSILPHSETLVIQSVLQLKTLNERLLTIFSNIYPITDNFQVYGHEIRNLLILACTEVEAHLLGILTSNDYQVKTQYNMNDYFKLNKTLRLDHYLIKLPFFPDVKEIQPFSSWGNSTNQALEWYQSYNKVKHNRETEFNKATLINAINAICAINILLFAQYGDNIPHKRELIGNFFEITNYPEFDFDNHYMPPFKDEDWFVEKLKIE